MWLFTLTSFYLNWIKKKKKNDIYAAPTRVYAQQDSFVYFRKIWLQLSEYNINVDLI